MIEHIDITSAQYNVDETTKKYVTKKIGKLDKFLPKHARKTVQADIVLREVNRDHGNKYECEARLTIPGKVFHAQDSTANVFAAVDIVEAKLSDQLRKHKDANTPKRGWRARSLLKRLRREGLS